MAYNREQLFDFPVSRLVDIIMTQQEQLMQSDADSKLVNKIRRILDGPDTTNEGGNKGNMVLDPPKKKMGRPRLSPEENARKYEERKAKQKERYKEMMAEIREFKAQEAPKETE